jgi:two-component system response regulator RegA
MTTDSRTLLIVEDDTPLRERLARAMRDRGYEPMGAGDRTSALNLARQESPRARTGGPALAR